LIRHNPRKEIEIYRKEVALSLEPLSPKMITDKDRANLKQLWRNNGHTAYGTSCLSSHVN